jgi:Type II secretion system protein B
MSYILDALKKSERERSQRGFLTGRDNSHSEGALDRPDTRKYGFLVGLVLIVLAGILIVLWHKEDDRAEIASNKIPATKAIELSRTSKPVVKTEVDKNKSVTLPAPTSKKPRGYQQIPFFWELPASYRQGISSLAVTIHVYSPDPAQRILFINNHEYKSGDRIREGARVEEIVSQGVVLSINGQRFKLPRPR